jgi:hypothetical protein
MPDDSRARLEAYAEKLLNSGMSEDDVVSALRTAADPNAYQGPTPGGGIVETPPPKNDEPGLQGEKSPLDYLTSPLDAVMAGAKGLARGVQKGSDWIAENTIGKIAPEILEAPRRVKRDLAERAAAGDTKARDLLEIDRANNEVVGMLPAFLMGGPMGEGAAGAFGAGTARTALGRIGANALGAGLGGAGAQVAGDVVTGNSEGMEGRAFNAGVGGAVVGGAASALGEAGRGIARAVKNSKGGQLRQDVEAVGGKVGPLSSGEGGAFAKGRPLGGLASDDEGVAQASRASAGRILNRIEDTHAAGKAPATAELNRLDKVFPEEMVDASDFAMEVQGLARHPRLTPSQQATVKVWEERLAPWTVKDPKTGAYVGVYMPAGELNALKGLMQDATKVGALGAAAVPTDMQRGAPAAAKALVDQTSYGPPNAVAHEAHVTAETQRRLLRLNDQQAGGANTPEGLPRTEVERVTNLLQRQGHKTSTSGGQNTSVPEDMAGEPARVSLDELKRRFPEHAMDVNLPRALSAKGDLEFRVFPDTGKGGLVQRATAAVKSPVVAGALAGGASAMGGHPVLAAGLGAAGLLAQNASPIAGRLMYGPAMAAGRGGQALSGSAGALGGYAGQLTSPLEALLAAKPPKKQKKNKEKRK